MCSSDLFPSHDTTKKGHYRKNTLYGQIERRLDAWAEKQADDSNDK